MQHDEKKCKKCGGYVVGQDAIAAMQSGICSHCTVRRKKRPKSQEEKIATAAHRAARLADRAMKNQAMRTAAGRKSK